MSSKRYDFLDIAKGIGILLVVLVHCNFEGETNIISSIAQSFFMPLFFVISGYLIKLKEERGKNINLSKTIKRYLKYFFIVAFANLLFYYVKRIIQGVFIESIDEIVKHTFLVFVGVRSEGGSWFLLTLLFAYCLFYGIKRITKKTIILNILEIVALCFSILIYNYFGVNNIIVKLVLRIILCQLFIYFGYILKELLLKIFSKKIYNIFSFFVTGIVVVIISFINNNINLSEMSLDNIILYIISGLLGTIAILNLSVFLSKNEKINKALSFFGKRSVYVLGSNQIFIPIVRTPISNIINNYSLRIGITLVIVVIIETIFLKIVERRR